MFNLPDFHPSTSQKSNVGLRLQANLTIVGPNRDHLGNGQCSSTTRRSDIKRVKRVCSKITASVKEQTPLVRRRDGTCQAHLKSSTPESKLQNKSAIGCKREARPLKVHLRIVVLGGLTRSEQGRIHVCLVLHPRGNLM